MHTRPFVGAIAASIVLLFGGSAFPCEVIYRKTPRPIKEERAGDGLPATFIR